MDLSRIDPNLKESIDQFPFSLEIDETEFLHRPELVQEEKEALAKAYLFKGPDTIKVKDIFL
ncbi:UNVERIFIED_CONTAM: hypothetical protein QE387_003381 [Pseudacidovorax intermedius]|nr:hypothetical protein [Pseudacidovorax intermedius]